MDKLFLFRSFIVAFVIALLLWDGILCLTQHTTLLPHRDLLLTGFLLWFVTLFVNQNRDDDWAGQL